jgi:hypothetical protein
MRCAVCMMVTGVRHPGQLTPIRDRRRQLRPAASGVTGVAALQARRAAAASRVRPHSKTPLRVPVMNATRVLRSFWERPVEPATIAVDLGRPRRSTGRAASFPLSGGPAAPGWTGLGRRRARSTLAGWRPANSRTRRPSSAAKWSRDGYLILEGLRIRPRCWTGAGPPMRPPSPAATITPPDEPFYEGDPAAGPDGQHPLRRSGHGRHAVRAADGPADEPAAGR